MMQLMLAADAKGVHVSYDGSGVVCNASKRCVVRCVVTLCLLLHHCDDT